MNKWHVISVTWSNDENLSNCWSNGEKLILFTTGNIKGSDHCYIGISVKYLVGAKHTSQVVLVKSSASKGA